MIPRLHSTLDLGFPLPINHSSIWLRTAAGHAFGDVDDPFANFFFGGFGNNYVDHETEKRYREYRVLPRARDQRGRRPQLREGDGRVELAAAAVPRRRQAVAVPELAASRRSSPARSRPTSISTAISRRTLSTIGAQIDLKVVLFSNMPSILSVGYATAFEDDETSDEFMISLKIL